MDCRSGCGACCIVPSISTPMPGHPKGKPAGTPCANLSFDFRCTLYGQLERPPCCSGLKPNPEMCGADRQAALEWLQWLERETQP